jgi:hypothetical protein
MDLREVNNRGIAAEPSLPRYFHSSLSKYMLFRISKMLHVSHVRLHLLRFPSPPFSFLSLLNFASFMNGLRSLMVSPFPIKMTGASVKTNPMKPNKLLAQWKSRFLYSEGGPRGKKAPKVFHQGRQQKELTLIDDRKIIAENSKPYETDADH